MMNTLEQAIEKTELEKGDIIQIMPEHKWGGCLAVVDEPKGFGCQCYVSAPPDPDANGTGHYYIRLNWQEFEKIGAKAIFELP
jgi:hypothetical protein